MQTITAQAGDNLFRLAAVYLGDATQWVRIALQNQLADPVLTETGPITIPDVDETQTGGVPPQ